MLLVVFLPGKDVEVGVDKQSTVACYEAGHVFGCYRLQQQCDRLHIKIKNKTTEVDNIKAQHTDTTGVHTIQIMEYRKAEKNIVFNPIIVKNRKHGK